jgi:hypothetical protein
MKKTRSKKSSDTVPLRHQKQYVSIFNKILIESYRRNEINAVFRSPLHYTLVKKLKKRAVLYRFSLDWGFDHIDYHFQNQPLSRFVDLY